MQCSGLDFLVWQILKKVHFADSVVYLWGSFFVLEIVDETFKVEL